jgi:hypothetical protein
MDAPDKPAYRAYVLDKNDRIVTRHDFVADDTNAALEAAHQWVDGHDVEVWQDTHIIGRLKHDEVAVAGPKG